MNYKISFLIWNQTQIELLLYTSGINNFLESYKSLPVHGGTESRIPGQKSKKFPNSSRTSYSEVSEVADHESEVKNSKFYIAKSIL